MPRFTGLMSGRANADSRLPVWHLLSEAAQVGLGQESPLRGSKCTFFLRTLACRYWPTGTEGASACQLQGRDHLVCEKDMCDDDLRDEMTPAPKPLETPQFRSSKDLNDGLFLPMTWESPLCLLFPQPRPRVGLLRLLPSPTLSKHAAPTELFSVCPAKLPQTLLLIKAKSHSRKCRRYLCHSV